MRKKFLRTSWKKYSKLGRGRKKKQKWRKPKGRHNKLRESKRGHIKKVKIGMKKAAIKAQIPVVYNLRDLEKITGKEIIIARRIGRRKKKELTKKSEELGIKVLNKTKINFKEDVDKGQEEPKKK